MEAQRTAKWKAPPPPPVKGSRHQTANIDHGANPCHNGNKCTPPRPVVRSHTQTADIDVAAYTCNSAGGCKVDIEYCAAAEVGTDHCLDADGRIAHVVRAGGGGYRTGAGVLDFVTWLRLYYGVWEMPLSEMRGDYDLQTAFQKYFCYYNRESCNGNGWLELGKEISGYNDFEGCIGAVRGSEGGSWWSCAFAALDTVGFLAAGFGVAGKLVGAAGRMSKAGDVADVARAGATVAGASEGAGLLAQAKQLAIDLSGAAGRACSFAATTPILLANAATIAISKIKPGDTVLATDPATGTHATKIVTGVWVHDDSVVDLRIGTGKITTTEDHPYWNATDHQWQAAEDLDPGDLLLTPTGTAQVGGLQPQTRHNASAYNLTVADTHTYYVLAGDTPVLVHNEGGDVFTPQDLDIVSQHLVNFMNHELTEAGLMSGGMSYEEAHAVALGTHPPGQNYDVDLIKEYDEFGPWWHKQNGLSGC